MVLEAVTSEDLSETEGPGLGESESGGDARRVAKSDAAFRTISEVAEELDVPQHVLRFWETKFTQIRPLKRGGGRRYYRPEDVTLLKRIRTLLYSDGLTIKGVQKLLRESGRKVGSDTQSVPDAIPSSAAPVGLVREQAVRLLAELKSLRDDLNGGLRAS